MDDTYTLKELNLKTLNEIFGYETVGEFSIEKNLNKETLLKLGLNDCIIYNLDSVESDSISNASIDYKNIIEARFFNDTREIRIFNDDNILSGTIFAENDDNLSYINNEYCLYPRSNNGIYPNKLLVKKYIRYDCDGQAYISYVKPCKFIFEGVKI